MTSTMQQEPIIQVEDATKVYGENERRVEALSGVTLSVQAGRFVAVVGPSGSGKSTLLNLVGAMDRPTSGRVLVAGVEPARLTAEERTRFRREHVGFVFQEFNLIETLTARENVELPLEYAGEDREARRERALQLLESVGLEDRLDHRPGQLSGGEKQRVGIARAFANDPDVILADEPTGNLDRSTGQQIIELLDDFREREGKTVVVVSHDEQIAGAADRVHRLRDGRIAEQPTGRST